MSLLESGTLSLKLNTNDNCYIPKTSSGF